MPATFATETTRASLFASTRWTMVLDAGNWQTPPDQDGYQVSARRGSRDCAPDLRIATRIRLIAMC
jgi:hypothetical protein